MNFTVGGVTFTFTEDGPSSFPVTNINSDNATFVLLFGSGGITFSPGLTVEMAQLLATQIIGLL